MIRKFVIKTTLSLTTFILVLSSMKVQANELCELKQVSQAQGSSRVDLRIGDRKVTLLGWTHLAPDNESFQQIFLFEKTALSAAKEQNCHGAAQSLQALLDFQRNQLASAEHLIKSLKQVDREIAPTTLAVEYSPENWEPNVKGLQVLDNSISEIHSLCPQLETLTSKVALIVPGPEYVYKKSRGNSLKFEAVEDEAVRSKVADLVFQLDHSRLKRLPMNPLATIQFQIALQNTAAAKFIDESTIQEVFQAQGNNEAGHELVKYLRTANQIIALNPARNARMADKILAGEGNYVFAIGNTHVQDLAKQIYEGCLKSIK